VTGDNLETGLVTIDYQFSSTFAGTPNPQFCALTDSLSLHFGGAGTAPRYVFAVDNQTKTVGTPVQYQPLGAGGPGGYAIFKVTDTTAIIFSTTVTPSAEAVIVSVSGTTVTVGTPSTAASSSAWSAEDFVGAPKVIQLTSTLYLASYANGTNTSVVAVSVSGTTVTIGTPVNIITSASVVADAEGVAAIVLDDEHGAAQRNGGGVGQRHMLTKCSHRDRLIAVGRGC